ALLREVYGDPVGALEWLNSALRLTGVAQTEERAWILCQIARVEIGDGKYEIAAGALDRADKLFPNYAPALDQRVELELAREQFTAAAQAAERLLAVWPHPRARYLLARSLHGAGDTARARDLFREFEKEAVARKDNAWNVNRELILYYAEFAGRADDAVTLARKEMKRRQDIWTLQAGAVALKSAGDVAAAKETLAAAMKPGTRDQRLQRLAAKL
ncbi:MAG: tetratricopeptide repeat protein, partial [Bryobacteraceae bacterium]